MVLVRGNFHTRNSYNGEKMGKVSRVDVGLLILRVGLGLLFLFYGSEKMFGVFGGRGYSAQIEAFIGQGFPPLLAHLAILTEFLGGLGLLIGFFTPLAACGLAVMMGVATYKHMSQPDAWGLLFSSGQAGDVSRFFYTFSLFIGCVAILIMGAGKVSLDAKLFRGRKG
jgi:putative oxidoreductase